MNQPGTLHFLPWMRRGLVRALAGVERASEGLPTRAPGPVAISVGLDGERVEQALHLRGPGEVVGLSPKQVLRCDPAPDSQDVEPNYFCCVELARPDLPWMFTPAAPDAQQRLAPWLVLVVVEEQPGVSLTRRGEAPLPILTLAEPAVARRELPDLREAWAWAHVQTSASLDGRSVEQAYDAEPERFLARLLCPRRLDDGRRYLACLVPSFRAGRRAGLGQPVEADDVALAWELDGELGRVELPVYHSWRFRTGPDGDFESLVRRLKPRTLAAGTHDLEIGEPGTPALPEAPGTLVSFAGPLLTPAAPRREWKRGHRRRFQTAMRELLNQALAANDHPEVAAKPDYDPLVDDPVVAPPAYGSLPAGVDELPVAHEPGQPTRPIHMPRWLGDANLDPVHRAGAGLGAEVVRREQESLMAEAWSQAAGLGEINQLLNWTRLAAEVGVTLKAAKIDPLSDGAVLQLSQNAHARLATRGATKARAKARSKARSGAKAGTVAAQVATSSLPRGLMSAAFRRSTRVGGPLGRGLGARAKPISAKITGRFIHDLPRAMRFAAYVKPPGCQIDDPEEVLSTIPGYDAKQGQAAKAKAKAKAAPKPAATRTRVQTGKRRAQVEAVASPRKLSALGQPRAVVGDRAPDRRVVDVPVREGEAELGKLADEIKAGLDVTGTLAAKLRDRVRAPEAAWAGREIPAAMQARPRFALPLYRSLRDVDSEYLLPGVGEIPEDSVGLAEVNAAFVEAFLLGANHELAREFMWREYPADLRDTWLRSFWDTAGGSEDIPAIAQWTRRHLGRNQIGAGAQGTLVLILKGQLLRRYPDTRIYAVKAGWSGERREPLDERREPIFVGAIDRSTVFLGFELGADEARGSPTPGQDAGWLFAFEQNPTGPRFGLDLEEARHIGEFPRFWAQLSWGHLVGTPEALAELSHAQANGRLAGQGRRYDKHKFRATWGADAAEMARITMQRPIRMLVHASAMLVTEGGDDGR